LGISEISQIDRTGPAFKSGSFKSFKMPGNFYLNLIPSSLVKALEPYIWVRPAISDDTCTLCQACKTACPQEAISKIDGTMRIDYDICIKCMCCHEVCPEKSVFLKRSRLASLIG
jgi:Pyruvate/2-oxoacid:ferredoxin oxidoreductase delta subunit